MADCKRVGDPMINVTPEGLEKIQRSIRIQNTDAGYERFEVWRRGPAGGPYTVEIYECPQSPAQTE